jgi:hypothetical protein
MNQLLDLNAPLDTPVYAADLDAPSWLAPLVREACLRVAPAFALRDLIAVNPFLGETGHHFLAALGRVEASFHIEALPSLESHLEALARGDFDGAHYAVAVTELRTALGRAIPLPRFDELASLASPAARPVRGPRIWSVNDHAREQGSASMAEALERSVARFLAARLDLGVARTRMPGDALTLYQAYLNYAARDRSPALAGLGGYRAHVAAQPKDAELALAQGLDELGVDASLAPAYFSRLFARIAGYSSYLRHHAFRHDQSALGELPELLAVLVVAECGLARALAAPCRPSEVAPSPGFLEDRATRLALLRARELAFAHRTFQKVQPSVPARAARPEVQALFCIDVRSERLRRHLEEDASIDTYGFAGFFGLPVELREAEQGRPQYPPLLESKVGIGVPARAPKGSRLRPLGSALELLRSRAVSSLTYVEAFGAAYLPALLGDALSLGKPTSTVACSHELDTAALPLETKVSLARGLLVGSGLEFPLAPVVALVGHGSSVTNNPQEAALACGACAGHSGAPNAILAARLLSDPAVRDALREAGLDLGATHFVAGVHDTMTDEVTLFGEPPSEAEAAAALALLKRELARAGSATALERSGGLLGLEPGKAVSRELARRSRDPAETRPEWALLGNAGFFVGRRARTRGLKLDGRLFLHSYDASRDPDGSWLAQILEAPVVVGSWINLQYYASSVAPSRFGSGHKTLHNVVGGFGVTEGNEGDLALGLSLESVSDGERTRHEPLRLQVVVEADPATLARYLERGTPFGRLVEGGWLALYALAPDSREVSRYEPGLGFLGFL